MRIPVRFTSDEYKVLLCALQGACVHHSNILASMRGLHDAKLASEHEAKLLAAQELYTRLYKAI